MAVTSGADLRSPVAQAGPAEAPAASGARACGNCGRPVATEFCGHCGQRQVPRLPTMRELFSEIVEDQLSLNGTLLRTAVPLLARPGFLTREYLDGRGARYIPPFRLFLAAIAVFLLGATWQVRREQPIIEKEVRAAMAKEQAREATAHPGQPARPIQLLKLPVDTVRLPPFARSPLRPLARRYAEINAMDPGQGVTVIVGAMLRSASRVILLVVPLAAALLQLVYHRRHKVYAEHFLVTLHLHAFWFVAMALVMVLPRSTTLQVVGNAWIAVYTLVALKRVYGGSWWNAAGHCLAFGILYIGVLGVLNPITQAVLIMSS